MEIKCTEKQYYVQDNADVSHKNVTICWNTNQFPELSFCGPHSKPHDARGFSRHYNLRSGPKLGNGIFAIHRI